jgi:hypothetical protein
VSARLAANLAGSGKGVRDNFGAATGVVKLSLTPFFSFGGVVSFLIYLLIILCISSAIIIAVLAGVVAIKDALGWFAPLVATFTGALFAFRLQEYKERTKLDDERAKSLDEALFILGARYNELLNIKKFLEPYRDLPEEVRALSVPATVGTDLSEMRFSYRDLAFLSQAVSAQLLLDLVVEESRFDAAMEALKIRADQHVRSLQPLMAEKRIGEGLWTAKHLEEALGEFLYRSAITNTGQVFDHVYRSVDSGLEMARNLHRVAKSLYGSRAFMLTSPPNE